MTGWLVAGIVLLGVVVLVLALMALGRRARPLERATRRIRLRTEQATALQRKLAVTQERMVALQEGAATMAEHSERRSRP